MTTNQEKRVTKEDIVKYLTESHLDTFGGYPYDYEWIENRLVIAELEEHRGSTSLRIWTSKQIEQWICDANQFIKECDDCDKEEAICETCPH